MNEKEKMTLAKKYIDYLSRGFNPLDESPVKNDDVVRNERISRCLMYVSEVLGEVIDKGMAEERKPHPERRGKKEEFYLSEEARKRFNLSDSPLTASGLAKGLSDLRDEYLYKVLSGASVTEWLAGMGFLDEKITEEGRTRYFVTKEGAEIGIFSEKRVSQNNTIYFIILFNKSAQQFVVDNLDAVIEHNRVRSVMQKAKRQENKAFKKYGNRDIADEIIADLHSAGATIDDIVYSTDLDENTVLSKMKKMNII